MATVRARTGAVLAGLGSLITLAGVALALILAVGIVFVIFSANPHNSIVSWVRHAAHWLAGPLNDVFTPKKPKDRLAINWGLAAVVYLVVGGLLGRLLKRGG